MKVIEPNPIRWGWKRGYTVDQIAQGLMIPRGMVIREIELFTDELARHKRLLKESPARLGGDSQKWSNWQRQKRGAAEALAAIEQERNAVGARIA